MILLITGLVAASITVGAGLMKPNDLRDYALSECLIKQSVSTELRDEGFRLGEIVTDRAGLGFKSWKPLNSAVDLEIARRPMMTVHIDAPVVRSDKAVPLAYCLAVIDAPSVKAAMARLRATNRLPR